VLPFIACYLRLAAAWYLLRMTSSPLLAFCWLLLLLPERRLTWLHIGGYLPGLLKRLKQRDTGYRA
jgi:hypothetical protein